MAASGDLCAHNLLFGFEARVYQQSGFALLLATFVIATCYSDLKPGVRILAAAGKVWPQDLRITSPKGRRYRTLALKRRGGMGAAL